MYENAVELPAQYFPAGHAEHATALAAKWYPALQVAVRILHAVATVATPAAPVTVNDVVVFVPPDWL